MAVALCDGEVLAHTLWCARCLTGLRHAEDDDDDEENVKALMSQTHTKGAAAKMHERRAGLAAPPAVEPKSRPPRTDVPATNGGLIKRYLRQVHPATNSNPFLPPRRRKGGIVRPTSSVQLREDGTVSRFQKNFELLSVLGSGSFSDVLRCRSRMDGCAYAVKRRRGRVVLRNGGWTADGAPSAARRNELKEVHAMAAIAHPHVLRYYVAWREDDQLYIQTELAWGSLEDAVRGLRPSNAVGDRAGRLYLSVVPRQAGAAEQGPVPDAGGGLEERQREGRQSPCQVGSSAAPPPVPPKTRARPARPASVVGCDADDGMVAPAVVGDHAPASSAAAMESEDAWGEYSHAAGALLRGSRAARAGLLAATDAAVSGERGRGLLDFSEDAAPESECVLPLAPPNFEGAALRGSSLAQGGADRPRAASSLSDSARAQSPLVTLPSAAPPRPLCGSPLARRKPAAGVALSQHDLPASGAGSKRKQASVHDFFMLQQQPARGPKISRLGGDEPPPHPLPQGRGAAGAAGDSERHAPPRTTFMDSGATHRGLGSPAKPPQAHPGALFRGLSSSTDGGASFAIQRPALPLLGRGGGAAASESMPQFSSFSQEASQWELCMPPPAEESGHRGRAAAAADSVPPASLSFGGGSVAQHLFGPGSQEGGGFLSRRLDSNGYAGGSQAMGTPDHLGAPPAALGAGDAEEDACFSQALSLVVTQDAPVRRGSGGMGGDPAAPPYRLGEEDVLALLADVSAALAHIHRLGLAHLDVKPANILVVYSCGMVDADGDWLPEATALTGTSSGDAALLARLDDGGAPAIAAEALLQQQRPAHASRVDSSSAAGGRQQPVVLDMEVRTLRLCPVSYPWDAHTPTLVPSLPAGVTAHASLPRIQARVGHQQGPPRQPRTLTPRLPRAHLCSDFGQCSVLGADEVAEGDSRYLARELLNGDTSNLPAADIFSLALSVVELAAGIHLPSGDEEYHALRDGCLPLPLLAHLSAPLLSLIGAMAAPDPAARPTAQAILDHPALVAHRLRRGGREARAEGFGESDSASLAAFAPHPFARLASAGVSSAHEVSVVSGGAEEPRGVHVSGSSCSGTSRTTLRDPDSGVPQPPATRTAAGVSPTIQALLAAIDAMVAAGAAPADLAETRVFGAAAYTASPMSGPTPLSGRTAAARGPGAPPRGQEPSSASGRSDGGLSDCVMAGGGDGSSGGEGWSPPAALPPVGVMTPFSAGGAPEGGGGLLAAADLQVAQDAAGAQQGVSLTGLTGARAGGRPPALVLSADAALALQRDLRVLLAAAGAGVAMMPALQCEAASAPGRGLPAKTPGGASHKARGGRPGPVTAARASLAPGPAADFSPEL